MVEFNIKKLRSGGLITNYYCTSKCKHCLYNCSPRWEKRYIDSKYINKCDLCTEIRTYLITNDYSDSTELSPAEFYIRN